MEIDEGAAQADDTVAGATAPVHFGRWNAALMRLSRAHRDVASQRMAALGLSAEQAALTMFLWSTGPVRQTELVAHFNRDSAAVTRIVQRLERSGNLRRKQDPTDHRATLVMCTSAGDVLRPLAQQIWNDLESAMLADMTEDEATALIAVLERVADTIFEQSSSQGAGSAGRLT